MATKKKLSNPQRIFNRVARHLLKQRKRSTDGVSCLYRGPGKLKCAVGCLIKDEHFNKKHNSQNVFHHSVEEMLKKSGIDTGELFVVPKKTAVQYNFSFDPASMRLSVGHLLRRLQNVHDCERPSRWAEKLRAAARAFGLDPSAAAGK